MSTNRGRNKASQRENRSVSTDHEVRRWAPNSKRKRLRLIHEGRSIGDHINEVDGVNIPRGAIHSLQIIRDVGTMLQRT